LSKEEIFMVNLQPEKIPLVRIVLVAFALPVLRLDERNKLKYLLDRRMLF